MLWLTRGGYRLQLDFNPKIDLKEFGTQFGPGMFKGCYRFKIDDAGNWKAHFDYDYQQVPMPDELDERPLDRRGAFYAQDYSRMQSNTAKRARKLAKPEWDIEKGRSQSDFGELLQEEEYLNATVDFSFQYTYMDKGKWEIGEKKEVSDKIGAGVNKDNQHLVSEGLVKAGKDNISIVEIKDEE